jgi:hypothetical protein
LVSAVRTVLLCERAAGESTGPTECAPYLADLDEELAGCRAAFVGAAVTEIAVLRAAPPGRRSVDGPAISTSRERLDALIFAFGCPAKAW